MITFHCIVSANYGCHVHSSVLCRQLVDPLLVNLRDQLLQTFHVLAVIGNLWANVTDIISVILVLNLMHFSRRIWHLVTAVCSK